MLNDIEIIEEPNDNLKESYVRDVFFVAINCGKLLLESGAETYRIEDTMMRISNTYGISNPQVFVTPTVIIFSVNEHSLTQTVRIDERANDLGMVDVINNLSRDIARGLPIKSAIKKIEKIHEALVFPFWLMVLCGGMTAFMFLLLFDGSIADLPAAAFGGALGVFIMESILRFTRVKFFTEFFASFFIAIISFLYVQFGPGLNMDLIIIAAVMPLVPGVLITNAVREMIRGHLLAGVMKGTEAMLTAFAIGAGVALIFMLI
ncbi:MAG TPA: threonine/serine exporter family protein [Candidatus Salinicoccus merdavium]|nr:threonine/serine exporter family protein [Candidatus Salinicoccus merdavium]